jgi:hypothetical protein
MIEEVEWEWKWKCVGIGSSRLWSLDEGLLGAGGSRDCWGFGRG